MAAISYLRLSCDAPDATPSETHLAVKPSADVLGEISDQDIGDLSVQLRTGVGVHGRVSDAAGQAPPGVEVRTNSPRNLVGAPRAITDDEGFYQLYLDPGAVEFTVGGRPRERVIIPEKRSEFAKDFPHAARVLSGF